MNEENSKWLVVVNPMASIGKAGKDWPQIKQILINEGIEFDDILTEYPQHAIEIVRKAIVENGYRKFIAVGGDGTNNEVINGIFTQDVVPTTDITMAVMPMGTGNDWRRTFGFCIDYQENANIIKAGRLFKHDIGKVTYYNHGDPRVRYFLNAAGTGLDEVVCQSTNAMKQQGKGGAARYMMSVAKCLFTFDCVHVQLEVDDQMVFDDEVLSLSVGNCRYNGGGMMMMPNAIPNDGLFDITVIRKVGLPKFAANISKIYDGSFIKKLKEVSTFQGRKIRITSIPAHSINLETEGETLTNSPFDFEMLQQAINMVVPEKHIFKNGC
ncbi:MAG: diacylglycerol kinase family lipid kinase [Bacteroidales bacterium]|nr:diacylglycerol kinase family lipid kinase [Bacteroidales bacterium]